MTIKEYNALSVLIRHCEADISYGEGGSYNVDGNFDEKEAKQAKLAIKYISRLLMKKNHQITAKKINQAFSSGKIKIDF